MENDPHNSKGKHRGPGAFKRFGRWLMRPFISSGQSEAAPAPEMGPLPEPTPFSEGPYELPQDFWQPYGEHIGYPEQSGTALPTDHRPPTSFSAPPTATPPRQQPPVDPNRYRPFAIQGEDDGEEDDDLSPHRWPRFQRHQQTTAPPPAAAETPANTNEQDKTVVVTYVRGNRRLFFRNNQGQDIAPPCEYSNATSAANAFDALCGVISFEDPYRAPQVNLNFAAPHIGRKPSPTRTILQNIANKAPEGTLELISGGYMVSFGNIAVASALSETPQDRVPRSSKKAPAKTAEKVEPAEVIDEAEDLGLTEYDHAIITTPDRPFVLPLSSSGAILTARCLEVLATEERGIDHRYIDIAESIWKNMPPVERKLFASSRKLLQEKQGTAIRKEVLMVLRGLTNRMKITREQGNEDFRIIMSDFSVSFHESSPEPDMLADKRSALLFPPGTSRLEISSYKDPIEITDEDRQLASTLLSYVEAMFPADEEKAAPRPDISHETAIEYLDFVMSREGKAALREVLKASGSKRRPDRITRTIRRQIIKPALASGYGSALRHRTVAGGHMTGGKERRAQQTGGALRGSTTKWHIGITYDDGRPGR